MSSSSASLDALRYPVGKFQPPFGPAQYDPAQIKSWVDQIAALPGQINAALQRLGAERVDVPYRPGGWSPRIVVHHVADSHFNAYCRFKWALTEARPTIKPYDENLWASLPDTPATPVEVSQAMIGALHDRWVRLMRALTPGQWQLEYMHPERGPMTLPGTAALYAWHGNHHLGHIENVIKAA